MNTRREAATALIGLPVIATAANPQPETILPFSEAAARIISYTIYAEARGEPLKGKQAVAAVIQTRARLSGQSMTEVCLSDKQFSCWNELDAVPEYYQTGEGLTPRDLKARSDCFSFAWVLLSSTKKWAHLTHFYNPDLASPSWASALTGTRRIGNHIFGYID